jgi:hypothetical protein
MAAPWDQQAGESAKAYAAFCLYRDLGPRRSLDAASRRYHGSEWERQGPPGGRLPRASGTVRRWAQCWNWPARARAWDQESERIKQAEQHAAIQEMAERHAKEALMIQNKAIERLRQLRPEELGARETLAYLVEAAKLERLARGEPTERVSQEHHFDQLKELTDDELAEIVAQGRGCLLPPSRGGAAAQKNGPQEPV